MADHSPLEKAIEDLRKLIREKNELSEVATKKIQKLTKELKDGDGDLPPFDPIDTIQKGFTSFRTNYFEPYSSYYEQLAKEQKPHFLVFACSDSRVSPTFILDFIPGKAFMARNIANLVPQFDKVKHSGVGAIIEYAVTALKVDTILVIGHSRCGGIKRLMTMDNGHPDTQYDFIDEWVKIATPAKDYVNEKFPNEVLEEKCERCEKVQTMIDPINHDYVKARLEAVNVSLKNLESYPYVKEGVTAKNIKLMGGYYDFVNGKFLVWNQGDSDHPIVIPPPPPPTSLP